MLFDRDFNFHTHLTRRVDLRQNLHRQRHVLVIDAAKAATEGTKGERVERRRASGSFCATAEQSGKSAKTAAAYADVITRDRVPAPDPAELGARFEHVWWELEPGDALVWRHRTLHGAPANTLPTVRRAIAYIWLGDDAFYDAAPGRTDPDFRDDTIPDGAPFFSDRFPIVRGGAE